MKNWLVLFQNCIEGEKRKPQQQLISVIFRHTYMMPGGKFGLTNGVGIPPVFCVSADKSLNFRLKHFTPIPKANDSEKTVMNSSSSVLPHYAKRETTTTLVQSSKMQNFSLWAVKWRIDFFCSSTSLHSLLCWLMLHSSTLTFDGPQSCHEVVICHFSSASLLQNM